MLQRAGRARIVPPGREATAGWWFTPLGIIICIGMLCLSAVVAVNARQHAWKAAAKASDNLATTLERDISRNLAIYDLSLKGVIANLATPGIWQAYPDVRQAALFDNSAAAEHLGAILVLDALGNIRLDSRAWPPRTANYADREYFKLQRDHPELGLYISRPLISRLTGRYQLVLSRRINRADGSFGGIVLGGMELSYFQDLFDQLDVGPHGLLSLIRSDGHIVAHYPLKSQDIDKDISRNPNFNLSRDSNVGSYVRNAYTDGIRRLFAYHHVGDYPLIVFVGVAVDDIFLPWRTETLVISMALLVLSGITMALSLLVRRELTLRSAAEAQLAESASVLAAMAQTDGLTGLANRRQFDYVLETECRRAGRDDWQVSLLIFDVDFFKLFNDEYGHQAGDAALRAVAACISRSALRPGDLGARYGGEEFAVILPSTDRQGAELIGQRLREAVADLKIPHIKSPHYTVTLSVGVATMHPFRTPNDLPSSLVREADLAMYQAKKLGRNRVVCSDRRCPTSREPPANRDSAPSMLEVSR